MTTIDGSMSEWSTTARLDTPATGTPGFGLWGTVEDNYLYFAMTADNAVIGDNTTLWLDVDLNRNTGYQIWGWAGGAEYHVEIAADGSARLFSGGPEQVLVAELEEARSSDGHVLEFRIDRGLLAGSPESVRVYADVNDAAFVPNSYATANLIVSPPAPAPVIGDKTFDGHLGDWGADTRLDTSATAAAGYAFHGDLTANTYVFAISTDGAAIGAGTTIWIDADLDRGTGYQIWGFTGGAEYNVNFDADGVARLYSGAAGQTFVADLTYTLGAGGTVLELAVPQELLAGSPSQVRVYADVNDSVFIPNSYETANLLVGSAPVVQAGGKTLDGDLSDWAASTRLDSAETGAAGYALHGDLQSGTYTFAITSTADQIGSGTTIWLDTDRDGTTGYQVWGWAVGAEYNINIGADGVARLYSGGAGQTLVAELDYARSADGKTVEFAVDQSLLNGSSSTRVYADVNDSVFIPNSYATANFVVGELPPAIVGGVTLDGSLSEWTSATLLTTQAGHELRGQLVKDAGGGDAYVFAIDANGAAVGANTTIWLDTDLNSATGYQIWGWAGGAEYNINITADGQAKLYSGAAGGTFVADLEFGRSADGSGFEVAVSKSLLAGSPDQVRVLADLNDAVFLPGDYASANLVVGAPPAPTGPVDAPESRIAIVYSATTADHFYDKTAYGQLFMAAQNQAMQAGIPFDLLTEADLLNPAALAGYDAIVFPGFSHAQSSQVGAIAASLATAVQDYGVGLIAAGNFLTNDETGAALAGDSYARMKSLLGVTLEGFGSTSGVTLQATGAANPIFDGYAANQIVGNYANNSYLNFTDTTGSGQVLFQQVVTGGIHDAVIATQTGGRNVHFATDAIMGNNNILGEAIDWVLQDNAPDVSLLMTRHESLFYSRNDMDQSQEVWDVRDQNPGIYDAMLPIIEKWYKDYGFVGSYYINVGAYGPDQVTDWAVSKPYYDRILALESEIGSHSYTHPHDTNLLLPDAITDEMLAARIAAYGSIVDRGVPVWSPYATHSDADPAVITALSQMNASQINAILADTLARTDPANPGAVSVLSLTELERAVLEASYTFQFEYSKLIIERELGLQLTGAAVPGAPERLDATREMIHFFDYLSGGYSGSGAGYPGAFGFLTPGETDKVYLAPNMSFDFSLIAWAGMTPAQAEAAWLAEFATLTANGTTPILAFPWHDYGPTNWNLGDPTQVYSLQMFQTLIATAFANGAEFVTGDDLARRIESFSHSSLTATRSGNVVTATVGSSDAGHFALDMGKEGHIASVANWYAWDGDSVFLPRSGGTFEITLGSTMADVTRIAAMPMRGDLISVSGDGTDLSFVFAGKGEVLIDPKTQGVAPIHITGADGATLSDAGTISLGFDAVGQHSATVDFLIAGAQLIGGAAKDILLGGSAADHLEGRGGNDTLSGGAGADHFVFRVGDAFDTILDFTSGLDRLELMGFGFSSVTEARNAFVDTASGLELTIGTNHLLLAGLDAADLLATDIVNSILV
ncbi:hypothetical protein [Paracoccus albicereus]|uniref:hypothetical protein n=1 Tax=Paracoccus albicereus TaxID=2922394 RepID=UPI0026EC7CEC|nr:hypothetical protein [Paracoccus albicereus]